MPDSLAAEKIQLELFPGEKLLWSDRPTQGIRFRRSDAWALGIGILFLMLLVLLLLFTLGMIPIPSYVEGNSQENPRVACGFWCILLLPLVAFLCGGGLYLNARLRRHLFYGITNERILIVRDLRGGRHSLISMRLQDVPHMSLTTESDETGSLFFAVGSSASSQSAGSYTSAIRFVPDVRKVYALIRSLQRAS